MAPYLLETEKRIAMETKICTKCGEEKELDLFYADKKNKDGKRNQCKECAREAVRKWQLENPEKVREINRKWRLENPEKDREAVRKWHIENPEKVREMKRKWELENPEKVRGKSRKWYRENIEKARERNRKRRLENPEKVREYGRKWKLENPEKVREGSRKSVRELKTAYVKGLLSAKFNIPASEITPLDIKEKREQIQYHRQIISLTKQLKQNENKS